MDDRIPVTSVNSAENLDDPALDLADGDSTIPSPLCIVDERSEIGGEELEYEHGVLVLAPEVIEQSDDVRGVLYCLEGLDFAKRGLVVVHLFESDDEGVGESASSVDVGVGAGANSIEDLVLGGDLASGVDAPALFWWRWRRRR